MSLSKVIEIARLELGVTENPPGSNRVKYWDLFGPEWQGQPWCVAFLAWVFNKAGERMAFFGGGLTASCGMLLRWYREQGMTVPVSEVQVGDIVLLNFHGGKDPEHCGLVVAVEDVVFRDGTYDRSKRIKTVEGNTTPGEEGSQDNGGCVALKTRYPSQIVAICRPQYKPEEPENTDDITGHWAEKAIRRCVERGLLRGYPDGSFGPDKPVTRAELAVILDRMEDDGK